MSSFSVYLGYTNYFIFYVQIYKSESLFVNYFLGNWIMISPALLIYHTILVLFLLSILGT